MEKLSEELRKILYQEGATLVGFADLSNIKSSVLPVGIAVAIEIPKDIVLGIHNGPTLEYYETYRTLNETLDKVVNKGASFLHQQGYEALAQTTTAVKTSEDHRTTLPHKTVATRAGLGWIGKSALLVTKEFGAAIRISSLLTNAPLIYDTPITKSLCGTCNQCKIACPGEAISGKEWTEHMDRDEFFDAYACRAKARQIAKKEINKEITLCGKCFVVCPYTRRYVES